MDVMLRVLPFKLVVARIPIHGGQFIERIIAFGRKTDRDGSVFEDIEALWRQIFVETHFGTGDLPAFVQFSRRATHNFRFEIESPFTSGVSPLVDEIKSSPRRIRARETGLRDGGAGGE